MKLRRDSNEYGKMLTDHWKEFGALAEEVGLSLQKYLSAQEGLACSEQRSAEQVEGIWSLLPPVDKSASYLATVLQADSSLALQEGEGLRSLCFCTFVVSVVRSVLTDMCDHMSEEQYRLVELYGLAYAPYKGGYVLVGNPKFSMRKVLMPLGITRESLEWKSHPSAPQDKAGAETDKES